ncbi:MAG: hypothetical protein WC145_12240 [Aliarcobacter sp.]
MGNVDTTIGYDNITLSGELCVNKNVFYEDEHEVDMVPHFGWRMTIGSGGRMRAATVGAGTTGGPVHVSLNLDGRVIAQHVIDMERRMQYGYPQR